LLDHVVKLACRLKVTRGRKLRTDGTVVERNIHHPTDSGLLVDGVRVLSRTLKQAQQVIQSAGAQATQASQAMFRSRLRSARNTAREISEATRRGVAETGERCQRAYQKLIQISQASLKQAQDVAGLLQAVASLEAQGLAAYLEGFIPLVEQAIDQTVRRLMEGEKVPAGDKIVSLFEPLTDIICRGKKGRPVEFGHKVWLDEIDGGLVSNYRVLEGNPPDKAQWLPSLQHHQALFGHPPDQASADRGVYSPDNEAAAKDLGVHRIILPKPGYRSAERKQHEKQPWFRRGRHYHHGVEGRISVLKRGYGLGRCLYRGEKGFERWIGWGLIAHNLHGIGTKLTAR